MENTASQKKTTGKTLRGIVVSDAMTATAVVKVERYVKHPKYGKFEKKWKRYKAHNEGNQYKIGDKVVLQEVRPMSKDKHFTIVGTF